MTASGKDMRICKLHRTVLLCLLAAAPFSGTAAEGNRLDQAAETFVQLTLRLGATAGHGEEVDSYFGPEALRQAARNSTGGLAALKADTAALRSSLELEEPGPPTARGLRLLSQVRSFDALLQVIAPGMHPQHSFEDEALHLYGLSVFGMDAGAARQAIAGLDTALPGPGPLSQRLVAFYRDFVVPRDRRRAVFERALLECRRRTLAHWQLPQRERLDVEWTESVPAAWHRYRGHWRSTLQINPDAVALAGSAIDVACHEAYPGHHSQFLLQDQSAQPTGLPLEDQVVLLRSPASVLREGAANFGVELAFPFEDRVSFDEHVLFPLAGLDPQQARRYETVHQLADRLSAAAAPIIAAYRDHRLSSDDAAASLAGQAQILSPAALLEFADKYGAYVLGYTAAREAVRRQVTISSQLNGKSPWDALRELVSDPYGASLDKSTTGSAKARPGRRTQEP